MENNDNFILDIVKKLRNTTMYIQNRRDSSKFKGCSPLQNCNGLISLKPAIAYFAYTKRYRQAPGLPERIIDSQNVFILIASRKDFARQSY